MPARRRHRQPKAPDTRTRALKEIEFMCRIPRFNTGLVQPSEQHLHLGATVLRTEGGEILLHKTLGKGHLSLPMADLLHRLRLDEIAVSTTAQLTSRLNISVGGDLVAPEASLRLVSTEEGEAPRHYRPIMIQGMDSPNRLPERCMLVKPIDAHDMLVAELKDKPSRTTAVSVRALQFFSERHGWGIPIL